MAGFTLSGSPSPKGLAEAAQALGGTRTQRQRGLSADNLLSSRARGLAGGAGRCLRHLESSIFLSLPNFVGAEFADG